MMSDSASPSGSGSSSSPRPRRRRGGRGRGRGRGPRPDSAKPPAGPDEEHGTESAEAETELAAAPIDTGEGDESGREEGDVREERGPADEAFFASGPEDSSEAEPPAESTAPAPSSTRGPRPRI